tara:strand:- start:930 stop:1055 length:126 start_codon:yes stop_codon:yes gene_type:complete
MDSRIKSSKIKTIIAFLIGALIALIVIYFLEIESYYYEDFE